MKIYEVILKNKFGVVTYLGVFIKNEIYYKAVVITTL